MPTPTVPSDFEAICASEEAKENGATIPSDPPYEHVRPLVKRWLSDKGLAEPQQELVLGKVENRTVTNGA